MQLFILNTPTVFIHSLFERSFGFSYVLETTFRAVNDINQIAKFACDLMFWRRFLHTKLFLLKKLFMLSNFIIFGQ